ncbi:predicted protein [Uncinocarpus reesii 1704]|uniref:Aminotransferase class I/classII large domain-containing protein n=1 Tax=Uncinocarpus reesii (strain UAMH 1704) TaxID=336963 RepID=C4JKW5_UNCRE|nr:uncharacterized protein UREG_00198 [Uncinocarpus reesii 1704]EEP75352.1 predicted protein [Uncinocarpus reesii 1704]
MVSRRAAKITSMVSEPWRFPPSESALYDREKNPNGIISFGTAENIRIPKCAFTYAYSSPCSPTLTGPMSEYINMHFKPYAPVLPSHIAVAGGVTALNDVLSFILAEPGDAILVNRPTYGRFEVDFCSRADVKTVYAEAEPLEAFKVGVAKKYEEALLREEKKGVRVRALIIVNPHNPLGRCYPPETIRELMSFCHERKIHFISDEIYALSVFDSGEPGAIPFTSALSIDPAGLLDEKYIHVTYGMAKDFSAPGLKLGFLITRNEQIRRGVGPAR